MYLPGLCPYTFETFSEKVLGTNVSSQRASLIAQLAKNRLQCRRPCLDSWVRKILWRRERLPTPVLWPGEFHWTIGSQRVGHDWASRETEVKTQGGYTTLLRIKVYNCPQQPVTASQDRMAFSSTFETCFPFCVWGAENWLPDSILEWDLERQCHIPGHRDLVPGGILLSSLV